MQLFLFCFWLLSALVYSAAAEQVAIVLSRSAGPYQEALQGIKQDMSFGMEIFNLEGDMKQGAQIMQTISTRGFNGVLAIGSEAVRAAQAQPLNIPLVYTLVLEPIEFPKNALVTGLPLKISNADQFNLIKKLFPQCKRIGVIYNPDNSRADVEQVRVLLPQLGLQLQPIAIEKREEIPEALNKLNHQTTDLLWLTVDKTTAHPEAVQIIIQHASKESLPFIGLSAVHVKAGALAAFSVDFIDLGRQAAGYVKDAFMQANTFDIKKPRKVIIYINRRVQSQLGITGLEKFSDIQFIE